jgi:hypothetical protein
MLGWGKTAIPLLIILSLFGVMACHVCGPYSVVNGPSTAFLSVKNATVIHLSIVAAGLMLIASLPDAFIASLAPAPGEELLFPKVPLAQQFCVFLC